MRYGIVELTCEEVVNKNLRRLHWYEEDALVRGKWQTLPTTLTRPNDSKYSNYGIFMEYISHVVWQQGSSVTQLSQSCCREERKVPWCACGNARTLKWGMPNANRFSIYNFEVEKHLKFQARCGKCGEIRDFCHRHHAQPYSNMCSFD